MKTKLIDERTEQINGLISTLILMLTYVAMGGVIGYERYVLGLPEEEYNELSWILCLSMGSYWALRLYLSGILPVISFRKLVITYFILVAVILIPTILIVGFPTPENYYQMLYPFIGVAVILGFYTLVAYLGKRRLEKYISESNG
jgi:hypothetical protein